MWKLILFNLCSHKIARLAGPLKNGFVLERARATLALPHKHRIGDCSNGHRYMRGIYVTHSTAHGHRQAQDGTMKLPLILLLVKVIIFILFLCV